MIKINDKTAVAYEGDFKPVNIMSNGKKIAGYKEISLSGKSIQADNTYNDRLGLTVKGKHEQDSRNAYRWNQIMPDSYGVEKSRVLESKVTNIHVGGDSNKIDTIINHKYLYVYFGKIDTVDKDAPTSSRMYFALYNDNKWVTDGSVYTDRGWTRIDYIFVAKGDYITMQHGRTDNQAYEKSITAYVKNIMLFDLTAMFGAGKEPTAEQFRKMFPCDYYPYNAGEWRVASGGQYVNFNQKIRNGNFSDGFTGWKCDSGSITITDGMAVVKNTTGAKYIRINRNYDTPLQLSHKYLFKVRGYKTEGSSTIFVWFQDNAVVVPFGTAINDVYVFSNTPKDKYMTLYIGQQPWASNNENSEFGVSNVQMFDLTKMFGEGNEPTTVEEFKALYPNEYYDYVESRYEYTPGYYENNQVVEHIPDTAFKTPMPELPEEIRCVDEPDVEISSKGVIWNQLVNPIYITKTTTQNGVTFTNNGDGSITINGVVDGTCNKDLYISNSDTIDKNGHLFYIGGLYLPRETFSSFLIGNVAYFNWCNSSSNALSTLLLYNTGETIIKAQDYRGVACEFGRIRINFTDNAVLNNIIVRPIAIDLTEIFGAGNEPQTVEEFRRRYPRDYYPYDPGTLRTEQGLLEILPNNFNLPFTLYGDGTVNDTVEPCVKVDGEWKCRVTKWWKKINILDDIINSGGRTTMWTTSVDTTNHKASFYFARESLLGTYPNNIIFDGSTGFCSHANKKASIYLGADIGCFGIGVAASPPHVSIVLPCITTSEAIDYIRNLEQPLEFLIKYKTPIIELYPPIPVFTKPLNTTITSDAECDVTLKVVDNLV